MLIHTKSLLNVISVIESFLHLMPKFNKFSIVVTVLLFILLGGTSIGLIYALLSLNLDLILTCGCGIFGLMYIILINPYTAFV